MLVHEVLRVALSAFIKQPTPTHTMNQKFPSTIALLPILSREVLKMIFLSSKSCRAFGKWSLCNERLFILHAYENGQEGNNTPFALNLHHLLPLLYL